MVWWFKWFRLDKQKVNSFISEDRMELTNEETSNHLQKEKKEEKIQDCTLKKFVQVFRLAQNLKEIVLEYGPIMQWSFKVTCLITQVIEPTQQSFESWNVKDNYKLVETFQSLCFWVNLEKKVLWAPSSFHQNTASKSLVTYFFTLFIFNAVLNLNMLCQLYIHWFNILLPACLIISVSF